MYVYQSFFSLQISKHFLNYLKEYILSWIIQKRTCKSHLRTDDKESHNLIVEIPLIFFGMHIEKNWQKSYIKKKKKSSSVWWCFQNSSSLNRDIQLFCCKIGVEIPKENFQQTEKSHYSYRNRRKVSPQSPKFVGQRWKQQHILKNKPNQKTPRENPCLLSHVRGRNRGK